MTPAELVTQIESTGGRLSVVNDGALLCDGATTELLNQLQPMKDAVIQLLQDRDKPRRYSALFTNEELQEARDRYESLQREAFIREHAELTTQWENRPPEKSKAEILVECYRDFPGISCAELAEGSGRSVTWVRRTLRRAGIEPPKAVRQKAGKP